MNKMIENAEAERTRLIELIKSLEMKLNSTEQRSIEEQWMLQQRQATLDAERVAFEREKNFMRKKMEDEEKKIQVNVSISISISHHNSINCFALLIDDLAGIKRGAIRRTQASHGYHRCRASSHSK